MTEEASQQKLLKNYIRLDATAKRVRECNGYEEIDVRTDEVKKSNNWKHTCKTGDKLEI